MSADFSRVHQHLAEGLVAHADRDGLVGVHRAVFLSRGRHAPGEGCPTEPPSDPHEYWCQHPDDECSCPAQRPRSAMVERVSEQITVRAMAYWRPIGPIECEDFQLLCPEDIRGEVDQHIPHQIAVRHSALGVHAIRCYGCKRTLWQEPLHERPEP